MIIHKCNNISSLFMCLVHQFPLNPKQLVIIALHCMQVLESYDGYGHVSIFKIDLSVMDTI